MDFFLKKIIVQENETFKKFFLEIDYLSRSAHTDNQYKSPILTTNFLFIYFLSIFNRQRFFDLFNIICDIVIFCVF